MMKTKKRKRKKVMKKVNNKLNDLLSVLKDIKLDKNRKELLKVFNQNRL